MRGIARWAGDFREPGGQTEHRSSLLSIAALDAAERRRLSYAFVTAENGTRYVSSK